MNEANPWLPADLFDRQTRSSLLAVRPLDKEPHLASGIARLLFGAATLKSTQQGRDSDCFTVPKKAFHSRASNSRFYPYDPRRIYAAAVEEAR